MLLAQQAAGSFGGRRYAVLLTIYDQSNGAGLLTDEDDFAGFPQYFGPQDNILTAQLSGITPPADLTFETSDVSVNSGRIWNLLGPATLWSYETPLMNDILEYYAAKGGFGGNVYYDKLAFGGYDDDEWIEGGYWYDTMQYIYPEIKDYFETNNLRLKLLPVIDGQGEAEANAMSDKAVRQETKEAVIDNVREFFPGRPYVFLLIADQQNGMTSEQREYANDPVKAICGATHGGTGAGTRADCYCIDMSSESGLTTIDGTHWTGPSNVARAHVIFDFLLANNLLP